MNVLENVMLPLRYQGVPRNQRKALAEAALEKVGLSDRLKHLPRELSGGQKQRLLIARALLSGRKVLMLDDATSALDYKSDALVRANIKKRPDTTLILVSQRATSVQGCDRIYVLEQGKVVGVGKHDELLRSCDVYREIYQAQVSQQ